jgi:hypothetical protein
MIIDTNRLGGLQLGELIDLDIYIQKEFYRRANAMARRFGIAPPTLNEVIAARGAGRVETYIKRSGASGEQILKIFSIPQVAG